METPEEGDRYRDFRDPKRNHEDELFVVGCSDAGVATALSPAALEASSCIEDATDSVVNASRHLVEPFLEESSNVDTADGS
jgi:hypothetical protein